MVVSHLKSLQALELALRMGSLQGAASALSVTPAAVGQRIKSLEDYLGIELVTRARTGLRPAPELGGVTEHLRIAFQELATVSTMLNLQRGDEIHVAATPDFADLWLRPRLAGFRAEHPHVLFCINGEGDVPLRIGPADCEISFGAPRSDSREVPLFHDFVLPISSPENTRRIAKVRLRDRLEGFPLLHLDFYKDDPVAPNWGAWVASQGLRRTDPNRGIRFRRIHPALEALLANAGLTICGLALIGTAIDDGSISLPFPISSGRWTSHAFNARFRADVVLRPQVKRFREWLLAQARETQKDLQERVDSGQAPTASVVRHSPRGPAKQAVRKA